MCVCQEICARGGRGRGGGSAAVPRLAASCTPSRGVPRAALRSGGCSFARRQMVTCIITVTGASATPRPYLTNMEESPSRAEVCRHVDGYGFSVPVKNASAAVDRLRNHPFGVIGPTRLRNTPIHLYICIYIYIYIYIYI